MAEYCLLKRRPIKGGSRVPQDPPQLRPCFKQINLNERGALQSQETANADLKKLKKTDLKEAKVDELKSSSSTKQFQILLVLMRKDFWYVLVLHFLIMYLLTLLVEDLVRLPYLRTSGRTEEFTLTRPRVNLKKKVRSKSSCQ